MKKLAFIIIAIAGVLAINAATTAQRRASLSAHTKTALAKVQPGESLHTFIKIDSEEAIETLKALGVKPECRFGNLITATIPAEAVNQVALLNHVRSVSVAKKMSVSNDVSRQLSAVDAVHQASGIDIPYTGNGVIVGTIDVGIDFNHITFADAEGNSRVKRVYMPGDESGVSPIIEGNTLPGSEYTTTEAIAALTTDTSDDTHGTHTTATAAGSYKGNAYYGAATEADLVMCAMKAEDLTDTNIANCLKYIANYAESVGKPAVINMSISSNDGPHDGTSPLCAVMDEVAREGLVCVVAAGNNGGSILHVSKTVESKNQPLRTALNHKWSGNLRELGYVSMWSDSNAPFTASFIVYNRTSGEIVYRSTPYTTAEFSDSNVLHITSDPEKSDERTTYDADFAKYFSGDLYLASELGDNDHMHALVEFDIRYSQERSEADNCIPGLEFYGEAGTTFQGWSEGSLTSLISSSIDGWTQGTSDGSISDMATGASTISVGAYSSRTSVANLTYENFPKGKIADFSSYGPDVNGISRPETSAPGVPIVSAISRYFTGNTDEVLTQNINGTDYRWSVMYGTSQACPMVTGIIALWLQADPSLTTSKIKEVLSETATVDADVLESRQRWGAGGKIDALGGLRYVIEHSANINTVEATETLWNMTADSNGTLTFTTPCDGVLSIDIYDYSGRLTASLSATATTSYSRVSLPETKAGIYLVKASMKGSSHTFKLALTK